MCVCVRVLHVFCIEACSHHEEALRARVTSSVSEHQTCQKPSVLSSLFPRKRQRKTCKPQDPTPVTINGGCQPLLTSRDARSDRLSSGADVPRPRSLSLVCTQHPSPQEPVKTRLVTGHWSGTPALRLVRVATKTHLP